MKTQIQLHDVQAHILRGAKPAAAHYLALSIVNVPAFLGWMEKIRPHLHSEARMREARKREHTRDLPAPYFINVGFSFTGLQKLGLHPQLLAQFPLPFQQGMAARASFIGDTGADAPERWQGKWGHASVHVFLALYYVSDQVPAEQRVPSMTPRDHLDNLLAGLELNNPGASGVVVLAGEQAQVIRKNGLSVEHFGFKDGISQPYVNDGMDPIVGGGKKASAQEDWEALATGEFLLGYPDELAVLTQGNASHRVDALLPEPADPVARAWFTLTRNGSFLVYRKIEQDVATFREKIKGEHGLKTAELMLGRQQNGSPLMSGSNGGSVAKNNLFDFSDDKTGAKCPMGSHIRRANPRTTLDTANRGSTRMVDQHRLIRRGMPYGAWLDEDSTADGVERGLHFLCYNANIETQFEFVQRNWINNSDFIGCPGAMVDPIVGNVAHAPFNPFNAPALDLPLMGLPSLTRIRGGEYFFVPGLDGLAGIMDLARRATPDVEALPVNTTPVTDPFDATRILGRAQLMKGMVYTTLPVTLSSGETRLFHYFAHPQDVQTLMTKPELFGNQHYQRRIEALTGSDMLLSMPPSQQRTRLKQEMAAILSPAGTDQAVKAAILPVLQQQLGKFASTGSIDLVEDLARQMPLAILKNYLGIAVPDQFPSPTEIAHFYDRANVDELPPEWKANYAHYLKKFELAPTADATLLFWVRMLFLEVFGNLWNVPHITTLATAAGQEFALHLRRCVDAAFTQAGNATVLQRLVQFYKTQSHLSVDQQKAQVQQRLLEFAVGSTDTTMKAIANTVSVLLQKAPTLEMALFGILQTPEYSPLLPAVMAFRQGDASKEPIVNALLEGLTLKILKAYPVAPILVRDCSYGATLKLATGQIADIAPGSTVVAVLQAASGLSLMQAEKAQAEGKPTPDLPDFVFLDPWSAHGCMGKPIALLQVREVLKGLLALKDVRTAAGVRGVMIEKYRLPAYQQLRCGM